MSPVLSSTTTVPLSNSTTAPPFPLVKAWANASCQHRKEAQAPPPVLVAATFGLWSSQTSGRGGGHTATRLDVSTCTYAKTSSSSFVLRTQGVVVFAMSRTISIS
jgi:hypothetical protein